MLSLIIPVYNFAEKIEENAKKMLEFLEKKIGDFELIFVDDGSTDETDRKLSNIANGNIRVISLEQNQGKGAAIKAGVQESRGNYIIFTDADLPYDLGSITHFIKQLNNGYEVILGSRRKSDHYDVFPSIVRRILSALFLRIANVFLIKKVTDTQCGIKGFSRSAALDLFARLQTNGFAFDVELIYCAQKGGYKIIELPVTFIGDSSTSINVWKASRMLFDLFLFFMSRSKVR